MTQQRALEDCVREVLSSFGLGDPTEIRRLGGTATQKFTVVVPGGRFVVRARPLEFAAPKLVQFDHQSLWRLAEHGLPVPCPRKRPDGTSWVSLAQGVFEVLSWIEGESFQQVDRATITGLGNLLARFHSVLAEHIPPGKEGMLREDHPDLLAPYLNPLEALCQTQGQRRLVNSVAQQLELVRLRLEQELYAKLPRAVIHGDIHPGNVKFKAGQVTAIYDFDYLSEQARCRDMVDALMFFASKRRRPVDPDDIWSLTQPFVPNLEWAGWLLDGYEQVSRLSDLEWAALPWLIRSQWIQIRLRGSRKVRPEEKLGFVTDGFFEVIEWLEHQGADFFRALQSRQGPRQGSE